MELITNWPQAFSIAAMSISAAAILIVLIIRNT